MAEKYHFLKVEPAQPSILKSPNVVFQKKYDGISSEVFVEGGIRIIGRGVLKGRHSDFTGRFPELIKDIKEQALPEGTDFLPEIIVIDPGTGAEDFSLVQARGRETNIDLYSRLYPAAMVIHDVFSVGRECVAHLPYFDRLDALRPLIANSKRASIIENTKDGVALWQEVERRSLEGLVIRNPESPLGYDVRKLKRELTEDVFCTGEYEKSTSDTNSILEYTVGGVKKKGVFGNLACYQLSGTGDVIKVCDLGSGFSQDDRKIIQSMLDSGQVSGKNPLVLEVKANSRYENGKLRNPTFLRIRTDKSWNQCVIKAL